MLAAMTSRHPNPDPEKCTRCLGRGVKDQTWTHHGVPGLCFACDGEGTRSAQVRKTRALEAEERRVADRAQRIAETERVIAAERSRHGTRMAPKAHRDAFGYDAVFATRDYAARNGLTARQAFTELACGEPGIRVAFDHLGTAIGWIRDI